jgi:hypothetical protein
MCQLQKLHIIDGRWSTVDGLQKTKDTSFSFGLVFSDIFFPRPVVRTWMASIYCHHIFPRRPDDRVVDYFLAATSYKFQSHKALEV